MKDYSGTVVPGHGNILENASKWNIQVTQEITDGLLNFYLRKSQNHLISWNTSRFCNFI